VTVLIKNHLNIINKNDKHDKRQGRIFRGGKGGDRPPNKYLRGREYDFAPPIITTGYLIFFIRPPNSNW